MSKRSSRLRLVEKRTDNTSYLTGRLRGGILKEEVWFLEDQVVKYSIAYIHPQICSVDNGRVLGYDNGHGYHHRHFMGAETPYRFTTYDALLRRFQREVKALWRKHENR